MRHEEEVLLAHHHVLQLLGRIIIHAYDDDLIDEIEFEFLTKMVIHLKKEMEQ